MMVDREVFKQLRKDGIDCLFTNRFLQNMKDSFKQPENRERFSRELTNEPHAQSRRRPIMILLGYLNFKVDKCNDAIGWFKKVLEEDPNNLNALLSLVFVHDQLKYPKAAGQYEKTILEILGDGSSVGISMACAKYELAAILTAVDAHLQPGGVMVTKSLFCQALKCKEIPDVDQREKEFAYAFFCFNVDTVNGPKLSEYFVEAVSYFYGIAKWDQQSVKKNTWTEERAARLNDVTAKAWCFLGSLWSKHERFEEYKNLSALLGEKCSEEHAEFTLHDCMEQANILAMESNKAVIYRRIGLAYMYMGDLNKAEEFLKDGVKLDEKDGYARCLVGRFNLRMFKKSKQIDILNRAIECFEAAIKRGFNVWHCFLDLAEAQFLKGENMEAVANCRLSETNGGKLKSRLFKLWADILEKLDDPKSATEMREKARLIDEHKINDDARHDFGAIYNDEDINEVAGFVDILERQLHRRCYFPERDTMCGDDLVDAWGNVDKTSKVVLVFCGNKEFYSHARFALHSIITKRGGKGEANTVVPVKLSDCKSVPDLLVANKPVVYNGSDEFVEELEKKLALCD